MLIMWAGWLEILLHKGYLQNLKAQYYTEFVSALTSFRQIVRSLEI